MIEAASTWTQTSDKDFDNGTLNNLTILYKGKEAEIAMDISEINEWTQKTMATKPSARRYHAMVSIWGDDKVLLFGGESCSNDTWVYDLSDNTWTLKTPINKPSPNNGYEMATIWGDDKVLLFGGFSPNKNDTWVYDLSDDDWTLKTPINSPDPRGFAGMAYIDGDDKVVLFGGTDDTPYTYGDTWVYDLSVDNWIEKSPVNKPNARSLPPMVTIYGTDKIFLYGGDVTQKDSWVYDLSDDDWIRKSQTTMPNATFTHKMAAIQKTDKVLLFGGSYIGLTWLDETWEYDLNDNTWTQKILNSKPSGKWSPAMAPIHGTDIVVLFGGYDKILNNETWLYKYYLPTMKGSFISPPHDTGAKSSFKTIDWNFIMPENTSIKLQLRSAVNSSNLYNKCFVGPDGNSSSYYTNSTSEIWSGHDGDRFIQYIIYLNIDNYTVISPTMEDVSISYNCLPETFVISPINGCILTNNKPTFEWTFNDYDSEQQKAFQVLIDDDINFDNVAYDSGERIIAEQHWEFPIGTSYTMLPDGKWYWKVRTKDDDGIWTDYSSPWAFTIDIYAPSSQPTIPVNDRVYNGLNTISGIATDPAESAGLNKVEIAIKNLNINSFWNGINWVPMRTWLLTSGTKEWEYNSSSVKWISASRYQVQSRAIDNATNVEVPGIGNYFSMDLEAPFSTINVPANNVWLNTLNVISGNAVDVGGSGVNTVEICIKCIKDSIEWDDGAKENDYWDGARWTKKEYWLPAVRTTRWSYNSSTIPWSTGNQYLIRSRVIDNVSHIEIPGLGNTFWFDDSPPEALAIYINNDAEYTESTNAILSLQAEDFGSGVAQMAFSTDRTDWTNWEPFNTSRAFYLHVGDGNKSVYFRVQDYAGNIAGPALDSINLDTTPPEESSILINQNDKYTNSKNVKLNLYASDSLSGISDMTISYDATYWHSWGSFNYTKSTSLQGGDGKKNIFFKIRDSVGNTAEPVFDSIILDTTPPSELTISINNGAIITDSALVNLKLDAFDETSGIDEVSFSIDNEAWSAWENYSDVKDYSLPFGDGLKSISFKVKDRAGNIAYPMSATIILNTTKTQSENVAPEKSPTNFEIWLFLSLFIIIFLIVIITGLMVIYKRNKRTEQELILAGILPIKQGTVLGSIKPTDQVPPAINLAKLPSGVPTSDAHVQQQIAPSSSVPVLAKTTETAQESISQQTTYVQVPQELPQLPPAEIKETKPEFIETPDTSGNKS